MEGMPGSAVTLAEVRERVAAAREGLSILGSELWRAGSAELGELMGEVDGLVSAGEAARVVVTREAMDRGEPGSGALAMTPVQWVRAHAPSTRSGGAAQVVAVAEAFGVPGNSAVKEAVLTGGLPVRSAAVVVAEADRLRPLLAEGAEGCGGRRTGRDGGGTRPAGMPAGAPGAAGALRAGRCAAGSSRTPRDGSSPCPSLASTRPGSRSTRLTLDPEGKAAV